MMETEHTPGPWEVHNLTDVFGPLGGESGDGRKADGNDGWLIADCSVGLTSVDGDLVPLESSVMMTNARLIAAALELLEACEAFVEAWEKSCQLEKTDVALRMARAAIAKARGEE